MKYKILFDLSSLQGEDRKRGIGRWTKNFLEAFLSHSKDNYDVHFLSSDLYLDQLQKIQFQLNDYINDDLSNFHVWHGIPFNLSHGTELEKSNYKFNVKVKKNIVEGIFPDIFFNFHQGAGLGDYCVTHLRIKEKNIKQVSVVYDFIPNEYPNEFLTSKPSKEFNKSYIKELNNQDYLLTISEFTRTQSLKRLSLDKDDVISVGTGISTKFIKTQEAINNSQTSVNPKIFSKIKNPFLLSVGVFEWRKNFDAILKSYKYLDKKIKSSLDLVLVSPFETPLTQEYKRLAKKNKVKLHIFYNVTDSELNYLYKKCKLFVFPSIAEGFGLPVLEAIHSDSLSICSSESSIPEIINFDKNYLFNPKEPREIAKKVTFFSQMNSFELARHKKLQRKYVEKWTWTNSAKIFIDFIEKKHVNYNNLKTIENTYSASFAKTITNKVRLVDASQVSPVSKALAKNFPLRKRYILLDVSILSKSDGKSGIQRVVRNAIWGILSNKILNYSVKLVAFENGKFVLKNIFKSQMQSSLKSYDLGADDASFDEDYLPIRGDIFLGLDLNHSLYRDNFHAVNNLHVAGVKFINIIYDILPLKYRKAFEKDLPFFHKVWLDAILSFGDVISISKTTSDDVKDYLSSNGLFLHKPRKLYSFVFGGNQDDPEIVSITKDKKIRSIVKKDIFKDSFIMLGTIEPRKKHKEVFLTFQKIWEEGGEDKLLIIGKQGWKVEKFIKKLKNNINYNSKVFWLDDLNDSEVSFMLANAKSLIFASKNEGLGLPLVEASSKNLTIIANDIPVFREVGADSAYYFKDSDELMDLIKNFKKKSSKEISDRVSWKKSAQILIDIIQGKYKEDFTLDNTEPVKLIENTSSAHDYKNQKVLLKSSIKEEIFFHGSYHNLFLDNYSYEIVVNSKRESRVGINFMIGFAAATVYSKTHSLKKGINKINFDIDVTDSVWNACELHFVNKSNEINIELTNILIKRRRDDKESIDNRN